MGACEKINQIASTTGLFIGVVPVATGVSSAAPDVITCALNPGAPGFNQCGYNYVARVFSGPADGAERILDGTVYTDPTYANDHLVMKWDTAWDACNAHGYNDPNYCLGAGVTNEWNGMVPGDGPVTERVKTIRIGSLAYDGPWWVVGRCSIWGNYETIMDQGMVNSQDEVWAFVAPNGLK